MSENTAADARDSQTADVEETPAADTQRNTQGEKAPAASADGDDYLAQRNAFLEDEQGFLKANGAADAAPETQETAESTEETAETEEDTEETETTEADATEEEETEEEAEETETTPKRKHVNLSRMGEDKAKLVMFLDKNPDVPLEKAVEILGLSLSKKEKEDVQQEAESTLPKTVTETKSRIDALWEERTKAFGEDLDFKKAADLDREIAKLQEHATSLQGQEAAARSQETDRFNTQFAESKTNAVKYYPEAAKADSPLVKRMFELDAILEETGDERFNSPDKPFLLAKAAAKDLGIMPTSPSSSKKSPPSAPSKVPASPVQPARGNARTTQTNAREGTVDQVVDNIRTEDDYEAAKKLVLKA